MKKVMKRKILLVIAAVLVLSLSVGFASAYFSDHEAAQGSAAIKLGGQTKIYEEFDGNTKMVSIVNTGETEVVVRVAIYGPKGMEVVAKGNWTQNGDYYYYSKILQVDESTPIEDLIAKIDGISKDVGDNFDIVVMQEAAQPTYEFVNGKNKVATPDGWNFIPDIYASEEGGE